ncbi:hypothetical protein A2335_05020 [Candidatus Peregrinibacteria bacterium RIFOXYB2_FULL_32_7]|nr:MAG: hypothetical protein A2335_05020 [Candidatus Peregrinibacteria bacterium RIFOXYB2_FULL_32_7]
MKKILITFFFILFSLSFFLFFSGCFGEEETPTATTEVSAEDFKLYAVEDFAIRYPKNWAIQTELADDFPETTIVTFTDPNNGYFHTNINIDKRTLKPNLDNISFAQEMLNKHSGDLINFKKIAEQNVKIKISGTSTDAIFAVFEGKNQRDGDTFKFMQIYAVKGSFGYTATGTMLNNAGEEIDNKLSTSLKTFEVQ